MNIGLKAIAALAVISAIQTSPVRADNETFDSFFRESGFAPKEYSVSPYDAYARSNRLGGRNIVGNNPSIKDEASWFAFQDRFGD